MATTPTLRPLSVGEVLDAGIKLFQRHWRPLLTCVVGIVLPLQILSVLITASLDPESLELDPETRRRTNDVVAGQFVVALVSALTLLIATAACFKAVSDAWLGATPSAERSLRFGLRRLGALFALLIVELLAILGALLVLAIPATVLGLTPTAALVILAIPGLWLGIAWSLAVPALLFERVGPVAALRRSFELVKDRWWKVFATLLVAYVIVSLIGGVIQAVLLGGTGLATDDNHIADAVATVIGGTLAYMIVMPYTSAVVTLLYFDQRVRKEGFDLQILAEGLGTTFDPDGPVPAPLAGSGALPEAHAGVPSFPYPTPESWTPPAEPSAGAHGWAPPQPESAPEPPPQPSMWGSRPSSPDTRWGPPFGIEPAAPEEPEPPPEAPESAAPDEPPAAPEPDEPEPKRDKRRADWLPPAPPRGPGGL